MRPVTCLALTLLALLSLALIGPAGVWAQEEPFDPFAPEDPATPVEPDPATPAEPELETPDDPSMPPADDPALDGELPPPIDPADEEALPPAEVPEEAPVADEVEGPKDDLPVDDVPAEPVMPEEPYVAPAPQAVPAAIPPRTREPGDWGVEVMLGYDFILGSTDGSEAYFGPVFAGDKSGGIHMSLSGKWNADMFLDGLWAQFDLGYYATPGIVLWSVEFLSLSYQYPLQEDGLLVNTAGIGFGIAQFYLSGDAIEAYFQRVYNGLGIDGSPGSSATTDLGFSIHIHDAVQYEVMDNLLVQARLDLRFLTMSGNYLDDGTVNIRTNLDLSKILLALTIGATYEF